MNQLRENYIEHRARRRTQIRRRWQWALLLLIIGTLGYFWLNPPGVITPRVAEKYLGDPSTIKLSEYSSITVEAAPALAQCGGNVLSLSGLTTRTEEAAQALAKFGGDIETLNLNGLTTLSPEAAQALAQFGGERLHLDGLTTLSPEAAKALAQFKGDLFFNPNILPTNIVKILKTGETP